MTALDVVKKVGSSHTVQRGLLHAKKASPHILVGVGIVGVVGGAVLASRASMGLDKVMDDHRRDIETIKHVFAEGNQTEKEYQKNLTGVYIDTGKELARRYWPAVTVGAIGVAALIGSHGIMTQRNAALVVAYKGAETALMEYRKRVIEEYGPDKDRDYQLGIYEENVVDPDTGKKKKVAKIDKNHPSRYAVIFDNGNRNWDPTPDYSKIFIMAQEQYANDLLASRGHVLLNDVYDTLGFDRKVEGALVGWVWTKGAPDEDNHIDFGIFDIHDEPKRMFVNGEEQNIILDFNVHGVVYDLIEKKNRR